MIVRRKNGVEFERKDRKVNYETYLNMKISNKLKYDLKIIAEDKGIKYQTLTKKILQEYVDNYMNEKGITDE